MKKQYLRSIYKMQDSFKNKFKIKLLFKQKIMIKKWYKIKILWKKMESCSFKDHLSMFPKHEKLNELNRFKITKTYFFDWLSIFSIPFISFLYLYFIFKILETSSSTEKITQKVWKFILAECSLENGEFIFVRWNRNNSWETKSKVELTLKIKLISRL